MADKLLVTPLYRRSLPLFRYEVADRLRLEATPAMCGSHFRRCSDVDGRSDEVFDYGSARVHPHLFRSVLATNTSVRGYLVRQTPRGAIIQVVGEHSDDELCALAGELQRDLARSGVRDPAVTLQRVDALPRSPGSEKLRRFIPLPRACLHADP